MTKLQNAYDTINDPAKRRAYDLRWPSIRDSIRAKQESDRRQAEAAQTEEKRAAEARARKQKEDAALQERLRNFELAKSRYDSDIFELSRVIRKLAADLKRLQDQDEEDLRAERERNGWWAYLASPIYGKESETDEQKQTRETKRLDRVASRSIKGSELDEKTARLQRLQEALQNVSDKIALEKKKAEDEKKREQFEARAREVAAERDARVRAMQEMRERMARARKEAEERAAGEAREAQAAQEAQERARMAAAAAAERRRREAEVRARTTRAAEEAAAARRAKPAATKSTCRHGRFWPKIEGAQLCSNCCAMQRLFAFECPGCRIVACASCRGVLRGERAKKGGGSGRRSGFAGGDGYGDDSPFFDYD